MREFMINRTDPVERLRVPHGYIKPERRFDILTVVVQDQRPSPRRPSASAIACMPATMVGIGMCSSRCLAGDCCVKPNVTPSPA
jgi:hypothetical protein